MRSTMFGLALEAVVVLGFVGSPILIMAMVVSDLLAVPPAILAVDGLCCQHAASVAQRKIERVEGVVSCSADLQSKTLRVVLKNTDMSTLRDVWDRAEQDSLTPLTMKLRGVDVFASELR